ncbi:hypothetical protein, partial [Nitrosomonas oligotropha]|uniref:hypothetical protein n=1 Tax=Nitrosomonas oligotropha TaxID=42354 RepID=UPI0019608B0A
LIGCVEDIRHLQQPDSYRQSLEKSTFQNRPQAIIFNEPGLTPRLFYCLTLINAGDILVIFFQERKKHNPRMCASEQNK